MRSTNPYSSSRARKAKPLAIHGRWHTTASPATAAGRPGGRRCTSAVLNTPSPFSLGRTKAMAGLPPVMGGLPPEPPIRGANPPYGGRTPHAGGEWGACPPSWPPV